jgi:hypothetical protein
MNGDLNRRQSRPGADRNFSCALCVSALTGAKLRIVKQRVYFCPYQSICKDKIPQPGQTVYVHWRKQEGHNPAVAKVFHLCEQVQAQRSAGLGDQRHKGHRILEPDCPGLRCPVEFGSSASAAVSSPCVSSNIG